MHGALLDHVRHFQDEMEEPGIFVRNLPVAGRFQECKVLLFVSRSYWGWLDSFPKTV
jgi:hypothetical protein